MSKVTTATATTTANGLMIRMMAMMMGLATMMMMAFDATTDDAISPRMPTVGSQCPLTKPLVWAIVVIDWGAGRSWRRPPTRCSSMPFEGSGGGVGVLVVVVPRTRRLGLL